MKILFTACTFSKQIIKNFRKKHIEIIPAPGNLKKTELISKLKNCQGYILGGDEIATADILKATDLKFILFYGTGASNYIDVKEAKRQKVLVGNTPGANTYSVAEYTLGLIMESLKEFSNVNVHSKNSKWIKKEVPLLNESKVGIIGMGGIGTKLAHMLRYGFNVAVFYWNRNRKYDLEQELGVEYLPLNKVFSACQIVSLHLDLNSQTKHIIKMRQLKLMKKNAVLVNTARANLVDPHDLYKAIEQGCLRKVMMDGYYEEPFPDKNNDKYGFLSLPDDKLILSPHNAYNSKLSKRNMVNIAVDWINDFSNSATPKYLVN